MERMIALGNTNIHVTIMGEGKPLLILPGQGEPCPRLEMKPLAEKLMDAMQVVIMDPPGYGESDPAATPRTIENMAEEYHAVMEKLGFSRYAVAAHSISGLYALYLMHRYPGIVTAFIGLDISVAAQFDSEFARQELEMAAKMGREGLENYSEEYENGAKEQYLGFLKSMTSYPYTEEELKHYGDLIVKHVHDPSSLDELVRSYDNARKVLGLTIPADIPSLMFIARENTKRLAQWEQWHRDICAPATEVHIMECDHYVHLMKTEETAALIRKCMEKA